MKGILVLAFFVLILVGGVTYLLISQPKRSDFPVDQPPSFVAQSTATPVPTSQAVDIKASFTIITGNITRSFTNLKYHNQSADVFIAADDPTVVHVKKSATTWADFFNTLPMKLTKDCLTTGDGETFCDPKDGSLKFFINDVETPNALEMEIKEDDKLLVRFTP